MKTATHSFQFVTASYLIRINNQKATNLAELRVGIEQTSDESIFHHTFQSLSRFHFLTEGFSNDFAQWVLTGLNRPRLAEQLAALDIRDYSSIAALRGDIHRLVAEYCEQHPAEERQSAFEPFYFSESIAVTIPLDQEVDTLADFRAGLLRMSHDTFYHHFVASRLRLQLGSTDFSDWFDKELDAPDLARRVNRIDIYTNTLDTAREELIDVIDRELKQ